MATITPAAGKGSVVKCNATVLKLTTWDRTRAAGKLPFATTGMAADADGQYETPHASGLIETTIRLEGPYDTAAPFHNAPYNIRTGTIQSFQFGQLAAGPFTPASYFVVVQSTDGSDASALGKWSAELAPSTDTSAGYMTSVT
jgi:hypothetical protein